ncbi:MAG TPA: alpha-E domain-containing protein [bacterium]|nr:alpha-E domain-containing protein [bacterium]
MLSRLADSLYWTGRYVERAENVARFIGVNLNLILDTPELDGYRQWQPLVVTTGDYHDFELRYDEPSAQNVTRFLLWDPDNPNSVFSSIRQARENARTMREVISSEMWEQLNSFYLMVQGAAGHPDAGIETLNTFCRNVKVLSHLFSGITDATLSHGEAWHFFNMGRLMERADKTARILDVKYFILLPKVEDVGTPYDNILWTALLRSASASEMYRKKHSLIQPPKVAEFLILDRDFPRSMSYCVTESERSLRAITGSPAGTYCNPVEQRMGRLRSELDYADISAIIASGLHEYLDNFQAKLNSVGEALFAYYFAASPAWGAPDPDQERQEQ